VLFLQIFKGNSHSLVLHVHNYIYVYVNVWWYIFPGIDCFKPANGETVTLETKHGIPVDVSLSHLKREAAKVGL